MAKSVDLDLLGNAFRSGSAEKTRHLVLLSQEDQIQAAWRDLARKDFMVFVRGLTIDGQTGPQVFENCIRDFQKQFFVDIAPNLHALRDGRMPEVRRYWLERTKKASKDADLAVVVLWMIAFPKRPIYLQVGAGDKNQAAIVKERILHLLHWNPWLNDFVEVVQWQVKSKKTLKDGHPMASMDIMSSVVAGAHGGTPDLLLINELSHVTRFEFAENLMDNADGVAQGMVIVATNAGVKGTRAEVWRNTAIGSPSWLVYILDRPAPWHSPKTIEEARKRNTNSRFMRLWYGQWVSGKGDALNEDAIKRCFRLKGPVLGREKGWTYLGGLDLGISHDHAALVVVGINETEQRIKLAFMQAWAPSSKTGKVDLIAVEEKCHEICKWLGVQCLLCDPHQAELMMQRLKRLNINVREMTFTGINLTEMADKLVQVVEEGRLELYDDQDGRLQRDLGKFNIVEKSYGLKLEAVSDEFGHADVGTALAIVIPSAVEILMGLTGLRSDDVLADAETEDWTEDEEKKMPDEFKDLFKSEDAMKFEQDEYVSVDPFEGID